MKEAVVIPTKYRVIQVFNRTHMFCSHVTDPERTVWTGCDPALYSLELGVTQTDCHSLELHMEALVSKIG